jgi:chemotaxis protein MotB
LALERVNRRNAEDNLNQVTITLRALEAERSRLLGLADSQAGAAADAAGTAGSLGQQLATEKDISARALAQVEALNQQIAALRRQLAALEEALDASEKRDRESQAQIADLGSRLNVALAQKVQELARYRSDFFGRLRQVLGNRNDIRIVGDRFVFQSEVFFDPGQSVLTEQGKIEIDKIATALVDLTREIPPDIPWVLRVDGHTDKRPLSGAGQFKSNWELSTSRAIAVVQYLIAKGIPPQKLLAAGFAEFQPLELGENDEAYKRNRRIELKLTER